MDWIDVNERLPEEGVDVLVILRDEDPLNMEIAYFDSESQCFWNYCGAFGFAITHWMPLPEPPK